MNVRFFAAAAAALACLAATAEAHFVWIDVEPQDRAWLVRAGFGDPGGWDSDYIDRITQTEFWARSTSGDLARLSLAVDEESKELRGTLTDKSAAAIVAACEYGVVQFGQGGPFYLRYSAKRLLEAPADWHDAEPAKPLRAEILARREGDGVRLTALHQGKPLAAAQIRAYTPDGRRVELTTDDAGEAHWQTPRSGTYNCYFGTTIEKAGQHDGQAYDSQKDYATLTFELP